MYWNGKDFILLPLLLLELQGAACKCIGVQDNNRESSFKHLWNILEDTGQVKNISREMKYL